jgi:YVTN family beta-propeller protein
MKRYFWRVIYLWILLAMPLAASTTRIYALNNGGSSVDVIDAATNKIVQTIEHIWMPHAVEFSLDGTRAYITSEIQDAVFVVDTKTATIIKKVDLGKHIPNVPVISKDGKRLYVCSKIDGPRDETMHFNKGGGSLDIIDTTSLELVKSVPMEGGGHDCYTTPDGKYVVAGRTSVVVIDTQTEEIVWELPYKEGVGPIAIEAGPDGSTSRLFVTPLMQDETTFAVVDFKTHKEVTRIKLPDEPTFKLAGSVERRMSIPVHGFQISPDGKTLWVASNRINGVTIYSLPELKVLGFVPAPRREGDRYRDADGSDPVWLTITPDGKTVYVANAAIDMVTAIDTKTMKEVARIPTTGHQTDHVKAVVVP